MHSWFTQKIYDWNDRDLFHNLPPPGSFQSKLLLPHLAGVGGPDGARQATLHQGDVQHASQHDEWEPGSLPLSLLLWGTWGNRGNRWRISLLWNLIETMLGFYVAGARAAPDWARVSRRFLIKWVDRLRFCQISSDCSREQILELFYYSFVGEKWFIKSYFAISGIFFHTLLAIPSCVCVFFGGFFTIKAESWNITRNIF